MTDDGKKKNKSNKIRFIPLEGSSLFALNRPFKAVLKDTRDPRIKKIRLEEDPHGSPAAEEVVNTAVSPEIFQKLKSEAERRRQSISARIEEILIDHYGTATHDKPRAATGPVRKIGDDNNPIDFILFHIIEATDLLLDEATPRLKEDTFRILHHALKTLLDIKKTDGGRITDNARDKLLLIMNDLEKLRAIADEEERKFTRRP